MANVTLSPNTPIELYAFTGFIKGKRLSISVLNGVQVLISPTEQFDTDVEFIPIHRTAFTRDGDSEIWVKSTLQTIINVGTPGLLTGESYPSGLFEGLRAMTTQNYTEANVKNGVQYSASSYFTGLTPGENLDTIIITHDKPIAIKAQYVAIKNGGDILSNWYRNPTYTGGTEITAIVTNQNDINPVDSDSQLFGVVPTDPTGGDYSPLDSSKPNVTDVGVPIQPLIAVLGDIGIGGSSSSRNVTVGLEQILAPNTTYLYRRRVVDNTDSLFGFSTWYEGGLDLPLIT